MFPRHAVVVCCLLATLFLCALPATAQVSCVPVFTKEYSSGAKIEPAAVKVLADGNVLVAGRGTSNPGDRYDGMVMKLDGSGAILWSFRIGGAGDDGFSGITLLSDGSFLLYGTSSSYGYSAGKGWLVHIDAGGGLLWSYQIGSAAAGADRVKAVRQYSDGDIVGTMNLNDSTSASDAVAFKMALDGTLKWAQQFDNGDNDSFTGVASEGTTVYVSGFYTNTSTNKRTGVIVRLNAANGSLVSSTNVYRDASFDEEITGLEVYNGLVSYGLWQIKDGPFPGYFIDGLVMVQKDLNGVLQYSVYGDDSDGDFLFPQRAPDNGFYMVKTKPTGGIAALYKLNRFGIPEWGMTPQAYYLAQFNPAMDVTGDGGCITAGYYSASYPVAGTFMQLVRMNARGETNGCATVNLSYSTDTLACWDRGMNWANQTAFIPAVFGAITPVPTVFATSISKDCSGSFCIDKTPLPPGCDKTYRLEYSTDKSSIFRDMVTTSDGGRIAVGDQQLDGLIVKFGTNGDVVWSKRYEEFFHGMLFTRILRTTDNNLIVFGSNYYTVNHGASRSVRMAKIDNNGNVLWAREEMNNQYLEGEMGDLAATPDGGFVIVINDGYGGGGIESYLVRYDANGNAVWQKQIVHPVATPLYRSIFCSGDAIFLGFDSYEFSNNSIFGVDRIDLKTGVSVWDNRYNAGPNTVLMNRVTAINDTVYAFLNTMDPGTYSWSTLLTRIDLQGTVIDSKTLTGDKVVLPNTYYQWDVSPPTVTLTPDFDFVMTHQVLVGSDTALNISRFKPDGTVRWSRNFSGVRNYSPLNIHPQASGFLIAGTATYKHEGIYNFTNSFLLKVDSLGQVIAGATGDCAETDRPLTVTAFPITTVVYPGITGTADLGTFVHNPVSFLSQDVAMDATQFCSIQALCGNVLFKEKGTGCSLSDTLTYLLQNATICDAAATWSFDPAFFKPGKVNGDSIELIPVKDGVSTLVATVEGNCSLTVKTIPTSIGHGADKLDLGKDTMVCKGGDVRLSAGPGFATYIWNDHSTDSFLVVASPGKYYVDITDKCGGKGVDTVLVNLADSFFHLTGDTLSCNQAIALLQATSGYTNYQWTPAYALNAQGDAARVSPAITTTYQVTAEKRVGCIVTAVHEVRAASSPPVLLGADTSICTGDSLVLDASVLFDHYQWSTGDTLSMIHAKQAGQYSVHAIYSNGCVSADTIAIHGLYNLPTPLLNKSPVLCEATTRVLDPGVFASYVWGDGSVSETITVSDLGQYWVTVKDQHGCKGADTVSIVRFGPPPSSFLPEDSTICQYGTVTILPRVPFDRYEWNDLSSGSSLVVSKPGLYWLAATDQYGCVGRDSIYLTGKQCLVGLYVPNAFTPNADGHNDVFRPLLYGNVDHMEFEVFNRYGMRVYQTQKPMQGWDGYIGGQAAAAGTYVWYCQYKLSGDVERFEKGTVILVR